MRCERLDLHISVNPISLLSIATGLPPSVCFEREFVKVLQSESPPEISQTSNDSPTAICPFGNTISCTSEDIGSALCFSDGFSSPSHSSNVSDLYATIIFNSSPHFHSTLVTVTSTLNDSSTAVSLKSNDASAALLSDANYVTIESNAITWIIILLIFKSYV